VVPEHGAGALDAVHELDHVLHGLHAAAPAGERGVRWKF
jgi:hypothetical protein